MSGGARTASDAATGRLAGPRLLRTFDGLEPTPAILAAIAAGATSGVTLFRARNVASPAQVRRLCATLQAARPAGDPPLLIGLDQEGGQLQAVGYGTTAWPGNLALGATRSEDLAWRFGRAIATEVAAMGGTLLFAPVCDVLRPSSATPLGTRSFGSSPGLVARLAAAVTAGIGETGVIATLKHFPGHGAAVGDSHSGLPRVVASRAELETADLQPFRAGIAAGARAVLPGHLAVPALSDGAVVPATVSHAILESVLREELGFSGLTVSDALDMGGAGGPSTLAETAVAAIDAGMDLLLLVHPSEVEDMVLAAIGAAIDAERLELGRMRTAGARVAAVRAGLDGLVQPSLEVVGCVKHRRLAREIAEASVTLVRDPGAVLPLRSPAGEGAAGRVALVAPKPADLTPAETTSYLVLGLASALRERGIGVDEFVAPLDPTPAQAAALASALVRHDVAIVGTFDAVTHAGQADLVRLVAARRGGDGTTERATTVAVALRSPYDVAFFPEPVTVVCTYGIQAPQIDAVADALVGRIDFAGVLPVDLAGTARVPGEASEPPSTAAKILP